MTDEYVIAVARALFDDQWKNDDSAEPIDWEEACDTEKDAWMRSARAAIAVPRPAPDVEGLVGRLEQCPSIHNARIVMPEDRVEEKVVPASLLNEAAQALRTLSQPRAMDKDEEPWGYGWYENGGKKMASGYLPTIDYPRSENVSEGPFPLFRSPITKNNADRLDQAVELLRVSNENNVKLRVALYQANALIGARPDPTEHLERSAKLLFEQSTSGVGDRIDAFLTNERA